MSEFRRRLMMDPSSVINRIKRLGCIIWLPLKSKYGLNDIISGRNLIIDMSSMFKSGVNNYELGFHNNRIGHINISDLTSDDFNNGGYTTIFQAKRYDNSIFRNTAAIWRVNNIVIGSGFDENGTAMTNSWTNDNWNEGVIVRHQDGTREVYANQILISNTPSTYPDIWNYSTIDCKGKNNARMYVKNFLLFNKALTEDEIAEAHQLISKL